MAAVVWFAAGLMLIAAEALSGEFMLLMLGGGAMLAAVATVLGAPVWLAAVVFAVSAVLLLALVRPALKRHLLRRPAVATNADALIGTDAVALADVGDCGGQVRIGGEVWSARPLVAGTAFAAGERLVVQRIDGAVAVVDRGDSHA